MSNKAVSLITTSSVLDANFNVFLINASGNITVTCPNITANGQNFTVKRIDKTNNQVLIQGYAQSQTIEGAPYLNISSGGSYNNFVSYGGAWLLI